MNLSATVPDPQRPAPSTLLAVGYRPVEVAFSSDDSRAFAVTEDGISVIDLKDGSADGHPAGPPLLGGTAATRRAPPMRRIRVDAATRRRRSDAAGDDGKRRGRDGAVAVAPDVSFTPDGTYALVRRDGLSDVTIDSLATAR